MRPMVGDTLPLYQKPCKAWRKEPSSYGASSMGDVPLKTEAPTCKAQQEAVKAGQTASARPGAQELRTTCAEEEKRSWKCTRKTNTRTRS